ncbi:unnamed protein product [Ambrosiozyma monospora]|uniref:Unnamed protein product n=1 Tax=Ambrosiozyma monospora TaxID=43982 RepID=A0ACB5T589_AMBMO|nr:unnamed protein product [Ambrosiozyma monospora]
MFGFVKPTRLFSTISIQQSTSFKLPSTLPINTTRNLHSSISSPKLFSSVNGSLNHTRSIHSTFILSAEKKNTVDNGVLKSLEKKPTLATPPPPKKGRPSQVKIIKELLGYIWPKTNPWAKFRVILALTMLITAKLLNVQVPFFFKNIIDSMNIDWVAQAGIMPATIGAIILAYGITRFGAVLFGELRNAIFAKVAQGTIMKVAHNTFVHLLNLDLNFHLSRQTGGLTRAMDRGTKGISYVLTAMVFHILPITFEISVVCGILTYNYGMSFAVVTLATMLTYSIFTIRTTTWRTGFRRKANTADQKAASVALDSLINYESH